MTQYQTSQKVLLKNPKKWLLTGVAGFIGSNLLNALLKLNQIVIGVDNFETGHKENLNYIKARIDEGSWKNFTFIEGDIRSSSFCMEVTKEVEIVLHQAALGSVPRSLENPLNTNEVNITGFINMLQAAKERDIKRFVYAASSSTYGDHPDLPKVEDKIGKPLSPYAVTKYVNEIYADVFFRAYGLNSIGLRYFNVFGPQQDPLGSYAAVIPKWIGSMIEGKDIFINGDGETSRDFCFVDNAIQANILAATVTDNQALNNVYNVAVGEQTSLNSLFDAIQQELIELKPEFKPANAQHRDFRPGDVRHSLANIEKAKSALGYIPTHDVKAGIKETVKWYLENLKI